MNRITHVFHERIQEGKKVLITYIVAGDPSLEATEALIYALERGGAGIIELGIPFSDPLADGPVIQAAALRSLAAGTTTKKIFDMVERVRTHTQIPLVLMCYYNTILSYGVETFFNACKTAGIDGVIIPDLPFEEQQEVLPYLHEDVYLIPLVAPTSGERIERITASGGGFVYCISSLGVTGMKDCFHTEIQNFLNQVRGCTSLPVAVGFGISSREAIRNLSPYVDGIIVGSAIVRKIEETKGNAVMVEAFIRGLLDNRTKATAAYLPSI